MDHFSQPSLLEQDATRALNAHDYATFERYVEIHHPPLNVPCRRMVQLKALFRNNPKLVPSESTYIAMGLYLLYLLACDRISEFHTEIESINQPERTNAYIRYPIQLERYIMEGNYAKVLTESRPGVFEVLYQKLQDSVRERQQTARVESAKPWGDSKMQQPSAMSIISNMVGYAADLERIV